MKSTESRMQGGFSLLEMMVAISILALALGSLYQAASGATRNVRTAERYAYGVELARSLLADNSMVPGKGVRAAGETAGGYSWSVDTTARPRRRGGTVGAGLHNIEIVVAWFDGSLRREIRLNSVVEEYSQ